MSTFLFKLRTMGAFGDAFGREKVALIRDPLPDPSFWQKEITTFEKADIEGLASALLFFIGDNQSVFTLSGALRPKRQQTMLVLDHDANVPLNLELPPGVNVVRRQIGTLRNDLLS